ncbi:hypothetical protein Cgig2_024801 [Carnegiea gigantea]|uniref:Uncharacterized protein n=1 Tax=Carnegiea gigantea TaxID=171969 RepID=A0A9Q1JLH2_9CARY|nr:hypothetical protein Cgig2_024801 [Carnegiea gigantea]
MGKKTTTSGPSSSGASKRVKTITPTPSTNVPLVYAQVARDFFFPFQTPQKPLTLTLLIRYMMMILIWKEMRMSLKPKEGTLVPAPPPDDEGYDPLLTRSHTRPASSGFNEAHFYQYMDDYSSHLNLRLDAIGERQQKHAQDQQELLRRQMKFDHRQ